MLPLIWPQFRLLLVAVSTIAFSMPVAADATGEKHALVIANEHYRQDARLPNAGQDATLMAATLAKVGFKVSVKRDLTKDEISETVASFSAALPAGATALVYYAGHGMQIEGANYLNPVDLQITSEQMSKLRSYPVRNLLERLAVSPSSVNIVILDACRNNPFRTESVVRYRSYKDLGLAPTLTAPRGTFIAYATAPGQLAADGKGPNGPYAAVLSKALLDPGKEIEEVFKRVSMDVRRQTRDDQIPWYETSLTDRYYFLPPQGVTMVVATNQTARAPNSERRVVRSSALRSRSTSDAWFEDLPESEWNRIDWEIQQRVARFTADELPALEHKARGGSFVAQTTLGLVYREGTERATVKGNAPGTLRFNTSNVKALKWLRQAAESGFAVAQVELGEMYYTGHGVQRDLAASRKWISHAAQANYPRAKLDLMQLDIESGDVTSGSATQAFDSVIRSFAKKPTLTQPDGSHR